MGYLIYLHSLQASDLCQHLFPSSCQPYDGFEPFLSDTFLDPSVSCDCIRIRILPSNYWFPQKRFFFGYEFYCHCRDQVDFPMISWYSFWKRPALKVFSLKSLGDKTIRAVHMDILNTNFSHVMNLALLNESYDSGTREVPKTELWISDAFLEVSESGPWGFQNAKIDFPQMMRLVRHKYKS